MQSLSEEEIRTIYEKAIKPKLLDHAASLKNKTCVFLGGQPGSGKSYLNDVSVRELETKTAIVIDTDLLRNFHPNKSITTENEIYSLDKDCYKWGEMLINDAIKENKNVLFDGTFGGNVEFTHKLMERFKENGYAVKLNLLATNDVVSKLGFNYRYQLSKKITKTGRPVDLHYHNQIYQKIPNNLLTTLSKNLVTEFNVYGRNHVTAKLHKLKSFDGNELRSNPSRAVVDYVNERTRVFTEDEIKSLKSWCEKTEKLVIENKGDLKAFQESIISDDKNVNAQLKTQIEEISGRQKRNELILLSKKLNDSMTNLVDNIKNQYHLKDKDISVMIETGPKEVKRDSGSKDNAETHNKTLSNQLSQLNAALTNVVFNLKEKYNLSDKEIYGMMESKALSRAESQMKR